MKKILNKITLFYMVIFSNQCVYSMAADSQSIDVVKTDSTKIPKELVSWWRSKAPTCSAPNGFVFPVKQHTGDACNDGDMNLFAGLMCASGEALGCETVQKSQVYYGQWFRSPYRAQTNNRGWKNSFSPDMALGTELYIVTTGDKTALSNWLVWLDKSRTCLTEIGGTCIIKNPLYRFCTDDEASGCTLRPVDTAMVVATARRFGLNPPDSPLNSTYGEKMLDLIKIDADNNKPGYSQHLVGVEIMLLRRMGIDSPKLQDAANTLSGKQPKNPFFLYLAEGPTKKVADLTLSLCPSSSTGIPKNPNEWAWEREDAEQAWKDSMLWDCIFMANLLGVQ